jgi:transcriptional regulator with XRE-family HTH domain
MRGVESATRGGLAMRVQWRAKQLRLLMAARLGRDVTQDEVSKATGISVSRISVIENGKARGVEFDTLEKLARFYGVSDVGELLQLAKSEDNGGEELSGNQEPARVAA